MNVEVDEKWKNHQITRHFIEADIEMERRSGRQVAVKNTNFTHNHKKKRKYEEVDEENIRNIFLNIVGNMEDFIVGLFLRTVDVNFRINMAMKPQSPYIKDVMLYYTEFCELFNQMERAFHNRNFHTIFVLFTDVYYKLAVNYYQTIQLFNVEN